MRTEQLVVTLPGHLSEPKDLLPALKLCNKESCQKIGKAEGGSRVCPRVMVNRAGIEGPPVGSLVAEDVGSLDVLRAIQDKGTTFPTDEVLGLVETEGGEATE